jgi:hypothetical protein
MLHGPCRGLGWCMTWNLTGLHVHYIIIPFTQMNASYMMKSRHELDDTYIKSTTAIIDMCYRIQMHGIIAMMHAE